MSSGLAESTLRTMVDRLVRSFSDYLRNRTVEQYYSAETAAKILDVTPRTFASYVALYEQTGGREGIGPKHVLSFKCVRYSATSINRFLEQRRMGSPEQLQALDQAAANAAANQPEDSAPIAV